MYMYGSYTYSFQVPCPQTSRLNAGALEFVPSSQPIAPDVQQGIVLPCTWQGHDAVQDEIQTEDRPRDDTEIPESDSSSNAEERSAASEIEASASEALPSLGSALHASGQCRPCAWFWKKGRGCTNAASCDYCHLCPEGELKDRKKKKVDAIRAGAIVPRSTKKWH